MRCMHRAGKHDTGTAAGKAQHYQNTWTGQGQATILPGLAQLVAFGLRTAAGVVSHLRPISDMFPSLNHLLRTKGVPNLALAIVVIIFNYIVHWVVVLGSAIALARCRWHCWLYNLRLGDVAVRRAVCSSSTFDVFMQVAVVYHCTTGSLHA